MKILQERFLQNKKAMDTPDRNVWGMFVIVEKDEDKMKKRLLIGIFVLIAVGMSACGAKEEVPATTESVQESVQEEVVAEETETETEIEDEALAEEVPSQEITEEVSEEPAPEEVVPEPVPVVFEDISLELTTYPIIKYTIMGEQKQLDYTMYESMYFYNNMVSDPELAIGYSTGDVTGDGLDDLVVSLYVVGNTLSDLLQDTYVYTIDADINDLNEILYIPAGGGEQFAPGFPNNIGAAPSGNGTLRLDLCAEKTTGGEFPPTTSVELVCQDGMWSVK